MIGKDHYGDPSAELDAIRSSPTEVASERGLLWVTGSDAVSFLQGLVSQDVEAMIPGEVARSMLMTPQGRLEALLWLLRDDGRVGIVTDGSADSMAETLGYYRIRVDADITVDQRTPRELWGPGVDELCDVAAPLRWHDRDDTIVASIPLGSLPRVVVFGELPVSGIPHAGRLAADAVRIAQAEPEIGVDLDEKTIPQESGLVPDSVSFTKGCFLGQELVARIDSRGRVNRHVRVVELDGPVDEGATVLVDGDVVGTLTSVTSLTHPPIGMGLLHRDAEPGAPVEVSDGDERVGGSVRVEGRAE